MSYSRLEKLLHRLALNSDLRCEFMFDLERSLFRRNTINTDDHIFVCGLARAGTTIFMRSLYETGEFASLTYRDMPFVMMPNVWKKISTHGSKFIEESERAHGDGIKIDYDSPEALEEVFWRVFSGNEYIGNKKLLQYEPAPDVIEAFREYISLVKLRYGKKRYLSKNNNNILRISALMSAFPASSIIVPFRDPVAQSASLLRQHKHFAERHRSDPFTKMYMNWLVHHEFGSDHRMFEFKGKRPEYSCDNSNTQGYWLEQWLNVYANLIDNYSGQNSVYFVCYEDLCSERLGEEVWKKISMSLNIAPGSISYTATNMNISDAGYAKLANRARNIYSEMRALSSDKLGVLIN